MKIENIELEVLELIGYDLCNKIVNKALNLASFGKWEKEINEPNIDLYNELENEKEQKLRRLAFLKASGLMEGVKTADPVDDWSTFKGDYSSLIEAYREIGGRVPVKPLLNEESSGFFDFRREVLTGEPQKLRAYKKAGLRSESLTRVEKNLRIEQAQTLEKVEAGIDLILSLDTTATAASADIPNAVIIAAAKKTTNKIGSFNPHYNGLNDEQKTLAEVSDDFLLQSFIDDLKND
jgi:hypothetical protein